MTYNEGLRLATFGNDTSTRVVGLCEREGHKVACFSQKSFPRRRESILFYILLKYIMSNYYVYIMASKKNGTLYVGVTSDLLRRTEISV